MNQQTRNFLFKIFAVLILTGAVLYLTRWVYSPYLFAFGAAGITLFYMTSPYQNLGFRRRRLHRINILAGISLIISSVFMFRGKMEWVVFSLIASTLILYTSFATPNEEE